MVWRITPRAAAGGIGRNYLTESVVSADLYKFTVVLLFVPYA
jgi:hypothetical protein